MSEVTQEQKSATANVFKNIVELLKHGMFLGSNAGYVHEAIGFLEESARSSDAND